MWGYRPCCFVAGNRHTKNLSKHIVDICNFYISGYHMHKCNKVADTMLQPARFVIKVSSGDMKCLEVLFFFYLLCNLRGGGGELLGPSHFYRVWYLAKILTYLEI